VLYNMSRRIVLLNIHHCRRAFLTALATTAAWRLSAARSPDPTTRTSSPITTASGPPRLITTLTRKIFPLTLTVPIFIGFIFFMGRF